ncbi:MAG: acyl carrier protein [Lachnospiraceae bacterium]|jgi:acyl carrier protein|nr:acyl carrier protein [Lachnospiraceae bacterium]MBR4208641.1 acyl carrier protein [Lachnospiraceae bacterium]MBR4250179.1 acyl carrier protein [Verrucomicrobiota bacterium]
MEKLLEMLEDLAPGTDVATATDLVDGHHLDSLAILSLVADLEDEFDITIPAVEIIPANFNSAEALWAMITRRMEE